MRALSDDGLRDKTDAFRARVADGETLDDLLPEAFAVVREAGRRVLNMRHYDVQLIGGMVLHHGKIAEMRTGEGKTLVATLPAYLNALVGQGRARRHGQRLPGAPRRGVDGPDLPVPRADRRRHPARARTTTERQAAYACDITYGTNNEFGFDYLRDNMKFELVAHGAARAQLRHRRRSRQHPHRRSAHAAHHLRSRRGVDRPLLRGRPDHPVS